MKPYKPYDGHDPSIYGEKKRYINKDIAEGFPYLYKKDYQNTKEYLDKFKNLKFIKSPSGYHIADINYIPSYNEVEVDINHIKKLLPKKKYIGGTPNEVRRKVFNLIPGLRDSLISASRRHNLDPNLMYERLQHEGFLDQQAKEYNNEISTTEQKTFFNELPSRQVNGFSSFGLDDSGRKLLNGEIHPIKSLKNGFTIDVTNEKGEQKTSLILDNLGDALEVKGAELQDFQNRMRKRGFVGDDLNTGTNASYNLGAFHKKLQDSAYVRKNYNVPNGGFE